MKFSLVSRIVKEDLAKLGELPKWIDPLITPINDFVTQVGQAVKNQLTFEDNFLCKKFQIELTHGVTLNVNPQSRLKVTGMLPVYAVGQSIAAFGMTPNNDGTIGITIKFDGGSSTTKAVVTFYIFF